MNNVERVVEPIVNLFQRIATEFEDDSENILIGLVLDKTNGSYHIGYNNGYSDDLENMYTAPLEDMRFFEEELVLASKKFAILYPSISIVIHNDDDQPIFSTFGKTLQEKVAEFHKISLRDIFVVIADHEGCEIEVCFFMAQSEKSEDKTQMIFTTNYFNPVATEQLFVKLLGTEAAFIDLVGFIGKFSEDKYTTVERAVEIVFEVFKKRVEEMARNLKYVEDIDSFFSDPVEPLCRKTGPIPITKHVSERSERWSFRSKNKSTFVDLTAEEKEENTYVLTDEVSPSFLFEYACSDIQETPFLDDFYSTETECLVKGWDDRVHPKLFVQPPFNLRLLDDWILSLNEFKHEEYYEEGFLDVTMSAEEPSPAKPHRIPDDDRQSVVPDEPEVPKTPNTSAIDYYNEKASGSSTNQRRTVPITRPQLGRGLDPNQSVELDARPRKIKSNFFTDQELEKFVKGKKRSPSPERSISNSMQKYHKIPKKQSSQDDWQPKTSVVSKSPYARAPIHSNTQSKFMAQNIGIFPVTRTAKSLQHLKFPYVTPTLPSMDIRSPAIPKFSSKSSEDEVIVIEEETENKPKSNDQNNNQQGKRRRLYNIEPSPERASYKFFKSKQNPEFKRFDGSQH